MTTSSRKKATSATAHETGYGKPPANHRFQKGRSGNPKGRPRKKKPEPLKLQDAPLRSQLETEAYRMLSLQENGKPVEMPTSQALLRTMLVNPLKTGNRLALKQAYELLKTEEETARQKSIDRYYHYANLKKQGEAEIKRCQEKNLPPPVLYPHPVDIHLDPVTMEIHILGPQGPEDVVLYQKQVLWRDLAMALSVDFNTNSKPIQGHHTDSSIDYFLLLSTTVNRALPPSMQRTEIEEFHAYNEWLDLSKKERKARREKLLQEINDIPCDVRSIVKERKQARALLFLLLEGVGQGLDRTIKALEKKKQEQGWQNPKTAER